MNNISKAKSVSISFAPEMFTRIDAFCRERGCTRSWLINKATTLYLDEALEDKRDYEIAAAAWKEFEASGDKGIPFDELRKKLNV